MSALLYTRLNYRHVYGSYGGGKGAERLVVFLRLAFGALAVYVWGRLATRVRGTALPGVRRTRPPESESPAALLPA